MTDESTNVGAHDTTHASQVIEPREADVTAQGRGVHVPEQEQQKEAPKLSTRDAVAKAYDESQKAVEEKAKAAADDAKAKVDEAAKAEKAQPEKVEKPRSEDGKFAKAQPVEAKADKGAPEQAAAERSAPDDRQSEGRKYSEPPARFLPDARTKWANVPNEVKAEVHRVSQEYEAELQKHKTHSERYEQLREYDEVAKNNGRDLKDSLAKVVEVERAIARNPIAGLEAVLREIGPRKADGSPLTLLEVAQHIVQNPQAYHQATQPVMPQVREQAPQNNREIEELRNEIQMMKAEQTIVPVITRFAETHPDYHALEPKIEAILKTGVIDNLYGSGLSVEQKLAEAYRMAGGTPPSQSEPQAQPAPVQSQTPARLVDPDGSKSIKGAPTGGQTAEPQRKFKSNREALEFALPAHLR